jgi:hypothetical protein
MSSTHRDAVLWIVSVMTAVEHEEMTGARAGELTDHLVENTPVDPDQLVSAYAAVSTYLVDQLRRYTGRSREEIFQDLARWAVTLRD